eukprot:CAMPEP_0185042836 /NCGR_PEP_ID=MMETSP1103-20130426/42581_1 /TAXON_ID=36769 /ORGANISM="Paraphysomonas bandaiensis, Strain Caron Lab Isolate" /LENGTH=363 /DNA_ID=CAMNT_0027582967 /DNA_START=56 /DNA_END=1144 /DNA_ORIENTATION=-
MDVLMEDVDSDSDEEVSDSEDSYYGLDTDEGVEYTKNKNNEAILHWFVDIQQKPTFKRKKKVAQDRQHPIAVVDSWTDALFERQFRMTRSVFKNLVYNMKKCYPGKYSDGFKNYEVAKQLGENSVSHIPLELKLYITLRMLAGASYLDMVWYGVSLKSVHTIFKTCLALIDKALPNEDIYNFPSTLEDFEQCNHEWKSITEKKRGLDVFPGTILAGDGLVIPINSVRKEDLRGLDLVSFRNRKGCFGLIVQAFCDAYGKFRYFEISWPGGTNDITAYQQTSLFRKFNEGIIPSQFHMVLDEAYSSIGGNQHLCPYTRSQLKRARMHDMDLYLKMKAFNNLLSSQRITIERAFGMLVRKFGILW